MSSVVLVNETFEFSRRARSSSWKTCSHSSLPSTTASLAEAWSLMSAVLCLVPHFWHLRVWWAVSISFIFLLHTLHEVKTLSLLTVLKLVTVTSFSGFSSMCRPLTDCRVRVVGDTVVVGVVLKKVLSWQFLTLRFRSRRYWLVLMLAIRGPRQGAWRHLLNPLEHSLLSLVKFFLLIWEKLQLVFQCTHCNHCCFDLLWAHWCQKLLQLKLLLYFKRSQALAGHNVESEHQRMKPGWPQIADSKCNCCLLLQSNSLAAPVLYFVHRALNLNRMGC